MLSIISITLALLCVLTTDILDVISIFAAYDQSMNISISFAAVNQFDSAKVMFMFIAFMFDLYKWCVFIASTGENVRADQNLFE